jgi:hypothetical protein
MRRGEIDPYLPLHRLGGAALSRRFDQSHLGSPIRHCEQSEAISSRIADRSQIASSLRSSQ